MQSFVGCYQWDNQYFMIHFDMTHNLKQNISILGNHG